MFSKETKQTKKFHWNIFMNHSKFENFALMILLGKEKWQLAGRI